MIALRLREGGLMNGAHVEEISIQTAADEVRWARDIMLLQFVFGGVALFTIRRPALIFDAPFHQATCDPTRPPAPPQEFPEGIEATLINSCPLLVKARRIALFPRAIRYIPSQYNHLYLELDGSFEQYLEKFSSKTRWTLRKKLKRFTESAGAEVFREYSGAAEMQEFLALSSAVSSKTFQQRLLDAGIPQRKDFPAQLASQAACGRVRGYILFHNGIPAAYALCYAHGDTLTLDKMGFDPVYAPLNAGTVLTYVIVQRLFAAHQFRIFDFGSGHFEYKALFATDSVRCAEVIYLRRTVRNLTVTLTHAGLGIVSTTLKGVLAVLGLKARARKFVHRAL